MLAGDIARSAGWSMTAVTAAYPAGNLVGALAGMTTAAIALAPSYGWFIAGACSIGE